MSDIKIFENFLPQDDFLLLQEQVLSRYFPWFYCEYVSLAVKDNDIKDPAAVETDGYHHVFYDKEWNVESYVNEHLHLLYYIIEKKLNLQMKKLIRSRGSVKSPRIGFTKHNYNLPHVDYFFPHETIIYYLNNSDGNTRIFDQKFLNIGNNGIGYNEGFTVFQEVEPKANRLLWFNGLQYHTASNPLNCNRRIVLNLNYYRK